MKPASRLILLSFLMLCPNAWAGDATDKLKAASEYEKGKIAQKIVRAEQLFNDPQLVRNTKIKLSKLSEKLQVLQKEKRAAELDASLSRGTGEIQDEIQTVVGEIAIPRARYRYRHH